MERTTIELQATAPAGFMRLVASWVAWIRHEREVRRAVDALMMLDDRQLADIGLNRAQAEHVARHGRLPGWMENVRQ